MQELMQFTADTSKAGFISNVIWVNLKLHQEMDCITLHGLKNESALAEAFIRFLTKATADNSVASVSKDLKKLHKAFDDLYLKQVEADVKGLTTTTGHLNNDVNAFKEAIKKKKDK